MNADWGNYFQISYTPQEVQIAAKATLSRAAPMTRDPRQLLLLDMVSEMACKVQLDQNGPTGVKVLVTSPDGHFRDQRLTKTSQFAAFKQARKLDLIAGEMLRDLAQQSATASVIAQVTENGDDPTGMIVQTVPLGFEGFIKESLPKRGILSRILGR
ncbi:hypothetical protein EI983_01910 [Roseovarius faecimaris]|uniref:Uncharacterized protein n=1 Tax=Roseovarius faecimaris TaxID=2494550 RepID=A0A6I6IPG0_9RHOB|nr:hypothetical protein [Roseovarius faecimaris]QGX97096.1 hypothetical protein EI983_01910 [Roseovarius faecimaris]